MKQIVALALVFLTIISSGCSRNDDVVKSIDHIKYYQDIPGVTAEEISAIEALKKEKGGFTYGYILETESFIRSDGTLDGFSVQVAKTLSELFGTEFNLQYCDTWSVLKDGIDDLSIDFTGGFTPTAERLEIYRMTEPIAVRTLSIYTHTSKDDLETESEVNGFRIGFLEDTITAGLIMQNYPEISFEIVDVESSYDAADKLKKGEIDAYVDESVTEPSFVGYDYIKAKEFFSFVYSPVSVTTRNHYFAPVISVIDKYISAGGDKKFLELYKDGEFEYTKFRLSQSFTAEEQEYLNDLSLRGGRVRIALEHDNYPLSFYNATEKEFQGIAVDVLREAGRLTGIEFDNVAGATTTWAEIMEGLRMGDTSLVSQLGYSEARKEHFIWSEIPYSLNDFVLISKSELPPVETYQIPRLRVGVLNKSVHQDVYLEWFKGCDNLVDYDTQNSLFDALESGEIDLVMGAEHTLLTQTNYREKSGFSINYRFNKSLALVFGFNKNEAMLRSIVDKALENMDLETVDRYWSGRVFDYSKKISDLRTTYLSIISIASVLALLTMLFMLFSNKRLNKNLTDYSTMLSAIFASIPDSVFCKNNEGFYTNCNPSFELQAGMPKAELIGKTYREVFKERVAQTVDSYKDIDKKILSGGSSEMMEETVIYPDGSQRLLETLKAPLLQNGKVVGLLGIGRDITERREIENRLERIINTAQIAFLLSIDGIVTEANEYSKKHIGVKIGDDMRPLYSDPEQIDSLIRMAEESGTVSNRIVRCNVANGESHRFLASFTFVEYEQQKAYIVWALDIEQDEIKTDRLRVTQQSFQTVLDALPMPIRIVDLNSAEIVYVNDSLLEFLEYNSAGEVLGQNITYLLPETQSDGTKSIDRVKLMLSDTDTPFSLEMEYRTKTGRIIEAALASRQIDYKGGRSSIGIIKDLTAQKEQARVLRNAADREKEANQTKSMFLASMSHEIRTPMNGIIGMTDLLLYEELGSRQLQYVKDIKASAESLLDIINDILDISKITEGKLQLIPVDAELHTLLKNTVSMMRFSAHAQGIDFIDDIRINAPEYVRVDDVRLKQVIVNLLSNAIKFTKVGHVKLSAEIRDEDICFEVSDTGMGIKKEDLSLIFSAFGQADTRKNRAIKGTGLGLSITKNIVKLMGGNIWIESEYGEGTTFYVTLPYVPGNEVVIEAEDIEFEYISAPTAQVLLVDDIQTNLTVGAGLLRMCGITADVAMSGYEAIELVKSKDYDIVFMDHMMPEMDGIETLERIRGLGGKFCSLPVVALTANAVNESRDLLLSSGMDDFLSKPIDKAMLMSILRKWLPASKLEAGVKIAEAECAAAFSEVLEKAAKIEGLDIELALSRIGGMQDVLEDSIRQVANSIESRLRNMDDCLFREDMRGFSIDAHGLKGALANIGAMNNSELAAELEIASKADNKPQCTIKFNMFASVMGKFAAELKSVFPKQSAVEERPLGDEAYLTLNVGEIIGLLREFEAAEARTRLEALVGFTFGEEKDHLLRDAITMLQSFKSKKAITLLQRLVDEQSCT